jgi:hypothetical protein
VKMPSPSRGKRLGVREPSPQSIDLSFLISASRRSVKSIYLAKVERDEPSKCVERIASIFFGSIVK